MESAADQLELLRFRRTGFQRTGFQRTGRSRLFNGRSHLMGVPDCLLDVLGYGFGVPDSYWAFSAMDWAFPRRLFEETIRRRLFGGDYSRRLFEETIRRRLFEETIRRSGAHDICWSGT